MTSPISPRLALIVIVGAGSAAAGAVGPFRAQRAAPCALDEWSEPRELRTAAGRVVNVVAPEILRTRRGVALFGQPASVLLDENDPATHRRRVERIAGAMLGRGGTVQPIPLPPGTQQFLAPRAASDGAGGAIVVWGTDSAYRNPGDLLNGALWTARFDGAGWSLPQRITTPRNARWDPVVPSGLVGMGGLAYLAVPAGFDSTLFLRGRGARWTVSSPHHSVYATLAALGPDTLLFGFLTDQIYVARSTDGGSTWSAPHVVMRRGDAAYEPQLLVGPGKRIILVVRYRDRDRRAATPDSVTLAVSTDGGRSWSRRPGLAVPSRFDALQAVIDRAGVVHVVGRKPDLRMFYALATSDGWRMTDLPFPGSRSYPRLGVVPPDSIYLGWTSTRYEGRYVGQDSYWVTRVAVRRACVPAA